MRNIVTPPSARAAQAIVLTPEQKQQWEEARAKAEAEILGRRQKIAADLAEAFLPISEKDRNRIRMEVALALPNKPMTIEEIQDWLDQRCIGVARYVATGKIVP